MAKNLVDKDGNINTRYLEKELQESLDFDIKYRQTDNMKKKAVRVATDYNEFKAMVACAHLKTLTKSEVESLSQVKKGWQKEVIKDKSNAAQILDKELQKLNLYANNTINSENLPKQISKSKSAKPKTSMEYDRDLRRIIDGNDKLKYIHDVGLKRLKTLLNSCSDTELIEATLSILLEYLNKHRQEMNISQNEKDFPDKITTRWIFDCLKLISSFEKFDLMLRFCSNDFLVNIIDCIRTIDHDEIEQQDRNNLIIKYEMGVKQICTVYSNENNSNYNVMENAKMNVMI
eukprot:gene7466-10177_t